MPRHCVADSRYVARASVSNLSDTCGERCQKTLKWVSGVVDLFVVVRLTLAIRN